MADETEIRVLVVDDEPVVLGLVTRLLERDGMAVEAVADGEQALARLRDPALRIDVAVVDATVGPRGPPRCCAPWPPCRARWASW